MFFASQISLDCTSLSWPLEDFHAGNLFHRRTSSPETQVVQNRLVPCLPGWISENPQHQKDWYGSLWSWRLTPRGRRLCTGYRFPSWPIQPWREHRHLVPLWGPWGGPGGEERPVYLHCTMFKGLEHSASRVTWQRETKVDVSGTKSNRGSILHLCRWVHAVPVHAIWSLSGSSPPVHRKWLVTATSGLSVVMPSACNAWLMHSALCKQWVSDWNLVTSVKSVKMCRMELHAVGRSRYLRALHGRFSSVGHLLSSGSWVARFDSLTKTALY